MKKNAVFAFAADSAERVLAHARYQQSRGRKPSLPFAGMRNPAKAVYLAKLVVETDKETQFRNQMGALAIEHVRWEDMTNDMLEAAVRSIITSSSSKEEVHRRVKDEIGYPYEISLHTDLPTDSTGREVRELVRGLGGLVMKNGALAMAMLWHNGEVISM